MLLGGHGLDHSLDDSGQRASVQSMVGWSWRVFRKESLQDIELIAHGLAHEERLAAGRLRRDLWYDDCRCS